MPCAGRTLHRGVVCLGLWLACAVVVPAQDATIERAPVRPHFDATQQTTEYAGPGREDPQPTDLDEVAIGYFGPDDPETKDAEQAVEGLLDAAGRGEG